MTKAWESVVFCRWLGRVLLSFIYFGVRWWEWANSFHNLAMTVLRDNPSSITPMVAMTTGKHGILLSCRLEESPSRLTTHQPPSTSPAAGTLELLHLAKKKSVVTGSRGPDTREFDGRQRELRGEEPRGARGSEYSERKVRMENPENIETRRGCS